MAFKYEGKCMVCNQMIKKNEMGFWSKGIGVKHEKCAEKNEDLVFLNHLITDNTFALILESHFYPAHLIKATSFSTISSKDSSNSKSIFLFLIQ